MQPTIKKLLHLREGGVFLLALALAFIVGCGNSENYVPTNQATTITRVDVFPAQASVAVGETKQYTVKITLSNNTIVDTNQFNGQIEWTSSVPGTAFIDQNGLATGLVPGTANINATVTTPQQTVTNSNTAVLQVTAVPIPIPQTSDRDSHKVSLTAPTATLVEGETLSNAFQLALSAPAPVGGLTVSLTVSGTAESGVDYSSPNSSGAISVVVPAGQTSFDIPLASIDRAGFQPSRTVTVSVNETAAYARTSTSVDTVTITDNDTLAQTPATGQVINRRTAELFTGATAIVSAIADADTMDGDILDVGPGTYNRFSATKDLTFYGPNAGIAGGGSRGNEAIIRDPSHGINSSRGVDIGGVASDQERVLTFDGFKFDDQIRGNLTIDNTYRVAIRNSVFAESLGFYLSHIHFGGRGIVDLQVQGNAFSGMITASSAMNIFSGESPHNPLLDPDPASHSIVVTNNTVLGSAASETRGFQFDNVGNVLVADNSFSTLGSHGINIAGYLGIGGSHQILNNLFDNVGQLNTPATDGPGSIKLYYGDHNGAVQLAGPLKIQGNSITGAQSLGGIAIFNAGGAADTDFTNTNFTFNFNNLTPGAGPGFINPGPAPTGLIDLTQNWWGTATPAVGTEITGTGGDTGLNFANPLLGPIQ